jgi:hypothetical protein
MTSGLCPNTPSCVAMVVDMRPSKKASWGTCGVSGRVGEHGGQAGCVCVGGGG